MHMTLRLACLLLAVFVGVALSPPAIAVPSGMGQENLLEPAPETLPLPVPPR